MSLIIYILRKHTAGVRGCLAASDVYRVHANLPDFTLVGTGRCSMLPKTFDFLRKCRYYGV